MLLGVDYMDILCINNGNSKNLLDDIASKDSIIIIAHGIIGDIELMSEVDGDTVAVKDLLLLSKDKRLLIIAGINAIIDDDRFCSAIVIDSGKLLGISNMTHGVGEDYYSLGNSLRIYDTSQGIIGVLIGQDIFYPECMRVLRVSGANYIVYLDNGTSSNSAEVSASANSLANGVYCIYSAIDDITIFDNNGKVIVKSDNNIWSGSVEIVSDKCRINTRREEVYKRVYIESFYD